MQDARLARCQVAAAIGIAAQPFVTFIAVRNNCSSPASRQAAASSDMPAHRHGWRESSIKAQAGCDLCVIVRMFAPHMLRRRRRKHVQIQYAGSDNELSACMIWSSQSPVSGSSRKDFAAPSFLAASTAAASAASSCSDSSPRTAIAWTSPLSMSPHARQT